MFILHFLHRFKHHRCSETLFFFFQTNCLLPSALLFPNGMEISQPPRCQTPKCHLLQAGENQVPTLNKSRLALSGGSGAMTWTDFAELHPSVNREVSTARNSHSTVFAGNGSNFSAAEPRVGGLRHPDGVEWVFVPLLQRVSAATTTFHQLWSIDDSVQSSQSPNFHRHLCWKMSFPSSLGKQNARGAVKQDESWVSSMENPKSNRSGQECSTLPRKTFQAGGFQDISAAAQGGSCSSLWYCCSSANNQVTAKKKLPQNAPKYPFKVLAAQEEREVKIK